MRLPVEPAALDAFLAVDRHTPREEQLAIEPQRLGDAFRDILRLHHFGGSQLLLADDLLAVSSGRPGCGGRNYRRPLLAE